MKYFIDQEFKEGFYKPMFGKNRHYIDLISIGIVAEDGREYYAISNEFDLKQIWNDEDTWVKDNVLKTIWEDLCRREGTYCKKCHCKLIGFTYKGMKNLLNRHGKSNNTISNQVQHFCEDNGDGSQTITILGAPEFYGYYADYDWVLLCSLFGRMIDLPKEFPMYCKDLKQILDDKLSDFDFLKINTVLYTPQGEEYSINTSAPKNTEDISHWTLSDKLRVLTQMSTYPKQEKEHSAIEDARWNKRLYDFIQTF